MIRRGAPSRAEAGYCEWRTTDPYEAVRATLEAERNPADPDDETPFEVDALELLDALMEAATVDGLGEADYDAPIGERIHRLNKPWLGELRRPGSRGEASAAAASTASISLSRRSTESCLRPFWGSRRHVRCASASAVVRHRGPATSRPNMCVRRWTSS